MLVFLIEIVGVEGVGGGGGGVRHGSEKGNSQWTGGGRNWEGGGGYAKMHNDRNGKRVLRNKPRTTRGGSRICKIQGAGGFPSCSPPPTKESGLPEHFNFH